VTLSGRVALVTGGGRGIGRAVAHALSEAGAAVAVAARTADQVHAVAAELTVGGAKARAVRCDVGDASSVDQAVQEVTGSLGPVDILVNNAGIASSSPLHRTSLEEWERLFRVNATGSFLCIRTVLPGMTQRGWGRIVNVASVVGLTAAPYIAAYAASKHAQVGLTRAAAAEVAHTGVTVNAVCPGYVDTPMTRESAARIQERTGRTEEEALEALRRQNPQDRLIQPREVAYAVLAFCSPDAGGINGQALVLDGGQLLA